MIHPLLRAHLEPLARRRERARLLNRLTLAWVAGGASALGLVVLQKLAGWSSSLTLPVAALLGLAIVALVLVRSRRREPDWRALALEIETAHPDLQGCLLTAVQQTALDPREFDYLQQRVIDEALAHRHRDDWAETFPFSRALFAQATHVIALVLFLLALRELRVPMGHGLFFPAEELTLSVTPGDVALERGSSLVVAARFRGPVPPSVSLVMDRASQTNERVQLVKNLADPLFGASVPDLQTNLTYHLEYGGRRTRDYKVVVFDYPRLERADAEITYPEYTGLPAKQVPDTRRISAVEGSRIDFHLQLNKAVAQATLISRDTNRQNLRLALGTNSPTAELEDYRLARTGSYELLLVDGDGRTNKMPALFVFNALTNRVPELRVSAPVGDTRPSPLEEMAFAGTVFDDFGVQAFGLASAVAGKEVKMIELGRNVPGREKRPFQFLLRLEELGLKPDDLMSWFVWADDVGPDGKIRRTTGDLFFAEVRAFEEIFREGQGMSAEQQQQQQQQQGGAAGGQAGRLAELQKQIINATWKLFRQNGGPLQMPDARSTNSAPSDQRSSGLNPRPRTDTLARASLQPGAAPFTPPASARLNTVFAQRSESGSATSSTPSGPRRSPDRRARPERAPELAEDMGVVREAQGQALNQAQQAGESQQGSRTGPLWEAVVQQMQRALEKLKSATNSPAEFQEALAAEQAAYQALLKLQEREYSISRNRSRQSGQNSRQQQMQRQLDQLDLSQSENRYETESQARAPQDEQRGEELQVMNRLQELARRQQDVNERLKELQSALQAAKTEQEREEIRRELKRLQEEEQQLLADADELRQRMDRSESQSRMSEQRQQLEQARSDLQRAAEAAERGEASQALAAGTRAQRQLQEMRDELRRQNASQFEQELRQMRSEARELARQQEAIQQQLNELADAQRHSLSDTDLNQETITNLSAQGERLTNLVNSATQLSRQAEEAEPLMARELYDTVRKFSQDETSTSKQFQEEFLTRPTTTRELYDRLKRTTEQSNTKTLDLASEMLRRGLLPDAQLAEERARAGINDLRRGVERAAQSVLGDDTESLRRAGEELDRLSRQLQREIAQGEGSGSTNQAGSRAQQSGSGTQSAAAEAQRSGEREQADANQPGDRQARADAQEGQQPGQQGQRQADSQSPDTNRNGQQASQQEGQPRSGQRQGQDGNTRSGELAGNQPQPQQPGAQPGENPQGEPNQGEGSRDANREGNRGGNRGGNQNQNRDRAGNRNSGGPGGDRFTFDFDRVWNGRGGYDTGPITGEDFAPWSDRLREVEELVDTPSLRTEVARAREQARQMRQDFRKNQKKPDWANVRLQVLKPLVEVREQIDQELARREPRENLVPIDRDPVPGRYSELVRRYYQQLGTARESNGDAPANPNQSQNPNPK